MTNYSMKLPGRSSRQDKFNAGLLLNPLTQLALGVLLVILLPALVRWELPVSAWLTPGPRLNSLLLNSLAFLLLFWATRRIQRLPGVHLLTYLLPLLAGTWLLGAAVLLFLQEPLSRQVVLSGLLAAKVWLLLIFFIQRRYRILRLALVPLGRAPELAKDTTRAEFQLLESPERQQHQQQLPDQGFDAVVADLHSHELSPEWEAFLASCALAHQPVWHYKQAEEFLTGRVRLQHLAENDLGFLLPSSFYLGFKRVIDTLAALLLLPLLLPLLLVIAVLIKRDSPGPIFFVQKRLGYRGQVFRLYKFRSMCPDTPGTAFTQAQADPRITRIGQVLRKYRLDELPQLLNILKGEMSFIGPRPESLELSRHYTRAVPFFSYRHVVRPGLSGWAQVNQGYAAEVDGMNKKLQYDFYYIKHFSLGLDVLIGFKTLRILFTGFGAR